MTYKKAPAIEKIAGAFLGISREKMVIIDYCTYYIYVCLYNVYNVKKITFVKVCNIDKYIVKF